eukprot:3964464-Amphidinium_carterae.1
MITAVLRYVAALIGSSAPANSWLMLPPCLCGMGVIAEHLAIDLDLSNQQTLAPTLQNSNGVTSFIRTDRVLSLQRHSTYSFSYMTLNSVRVIFVSG